MDHIGRWENGVPCFLRTEEELNECIDKEMRDYNDEDRERDKSYWEAIGR